MKFNQSAVFKVAKWILIVLLLVVLGGGCLVGGIWALLDGEFMGLVLVFDGVLLIWLTIVAFYSMAAITFSDEGIAIRVFVRTRHYSWDEIIQAGVLWRRKKYGYYNDFVLLPKSGRMCDPHKYSFVLRNLFQLIHLPYTPDTVSCVLSHYGPLDFDYSNGQGLKNMKSK